MQRNPVISLYFPWWMSQNISWPIRQLKAMWEFQRTTSLHTSGCNFFSHIEQGFLFFPLKILKIESHELFKVAQVIIWQLRQQSQVSLFMHWHLWVSVMDPNFITLGLSTALWLKKYSPPKTKNLESLRFSWGRNMESPRLLYLHLIISLVFWASWNFEW